MGSTDNGEESANVTKFWLSIPLCTMREQRSQQAAPTRAKRQNSAAKLSICCKKKGKSSSPRFETISYDAFQVCIYHDDVACAKVFASLAVDAKRVWNGNDSCELPQKEELGRNHTVSHFKRRNGLLRVAAAVAASLQHLHTRMNGSGAERAEKEKRGKNLGKDGLFLSNSGYRQLFSSHHVLKFSKKNCPTSQHRPIYDSHYRSLLPKKERKKENEKKNKKKRKKPSNHNSAAITAATPTTPPTTGTAPRPAAL